MKIREKQADYNAFCKKTGRTKRLDRTQVFDYNKSVSGKATAAVKRQKVLAEAKANYISNIKPTLPKDNAKLPDTTLQKGFNVDIKTKEGYALHGVIPSYTSVSDVRIIAGYGVQTEFRNSSNLQSNLGMKLINGRRSAA